MQHIHVARTNESESERSPHFIRHKAAIRPPWKHRKVNRSFDDSALEAVRLARRQMGWKADEAYAHPATSVRSLNLGRKHMYIQTQSQGVSLMHATQKSPGVTGNQTSHRITWAT